MASRDTNKKYDFLGDVPRIVARVHALARKFNLTAEQRDEVVQETMVRAIKGVEKFRGAAELDTWAFQIMRHTVGRIAGADRKAQELVRRLGALQAPPSLDHQIPEPVVELEVRELLELLEAEIQALPDLQRQVMQMRLLHLTPLEISRRLSTPVDKVRSALRTAQKTLKRRLRLRGYEPG